MGTVSIFSGYTFLYYAFVLYTVHLCVFQSAGGGPTPLKRNTMYVAEGLFYAVDFGCIDRMTHD